VFSTVFSSFGGCGVPRVDGAGRRAAPAFVRFIAGEADFAVPRAEDDLRAPEAELPAPLADDLRAPDAGLRDAADLRAPDDFFAALFALLLAPPLPALRPPLPDCPFASIALRSGDARSDLAYATS